MSEINAYKFSETACEVKPNILGDKTPKEFIALHYDGGYHFGIDNLRRYGCYRIHGWSFDFIPYLKLYVYKQYGSWQESFAPNKTLLRKQVSGAITIIIEVK